ncbi:SUMF1/EgtB/PvdO family nonheme iron enzyme [Lentisphaerota bacterium WC36G]|nr:SUMF1/EgtB/PvdO family nonheme iron enzyme [Lentisphaerae bacterium WC36]
MLKREKKQSISAALFLAGCLLSSSASAELNYIVYGGKVKSFNDITKKSVIDGGKAKKISSLGNVAKRDTWGVEYYGEINIPKDGKYTFALTSDDGSGLFIGEKCIINNDGNHGSITKKSTIKLKKGIHKVSILYFNGGGGHNLKATVNGNGFKNADLAKVSNPTKARLDFEAIRKARQLEQKFAAAKATFQYSTPEAFKRSVKYLMKNFPGKYSKGREYLAKIAEFEKLLPEIKKSLNDKSEKYLDKVAEYRKLQKEALVDNNPAIDFEDLLVVKTNRVALPANWLGTHTLGKTGYNNEIAKYNLKTGNLERVYKAKGSNYLGEIDLSYDGNKILFTSIGDNGAYQVMEVGVDGNNLRQVTQINERFVDNYNGIYLPSGKIIFSSTAPLVGVPCIRGSRTVPNLYSMDSDGSNVRQLTFEQDADWYPSVTANGQIMYLRWEYTDIMHYYSRIMMTMNPDGTNQRAVYGSQSLWPNSMFYARPIPGKDSQYVAIVTGHHGTARAGELTIFDTNKGFKEIDGVVQQIPGYKKEVKWVVKDQLVNNSWPKFLQPYPINDTYFFVVGKMNGRDSWNLYLVDKFDNMIMLPNRFGGALLEPFPLTKRVKPPVIPDRVNLKEKEATLYIQDIYRGQGSRGLKRGTVKELRIFTYAYGYYKAGNHNHLGIEGGWDVKRILGTVKVEKDGSAMFKVPANTTISIQPLDENGSAIQLMRSWLVAMPGEKLSCIGCHENPNEPPVTRKTIASTKEPQIITPRREKVEGFSYELEVQPVLDAYCISCHDGTNPKIPDFKTRKLVSNKEGANYSVSYYNLHKFFRRPGPESDAYMFNPYEFHSSTSEGFQLLEKGHHGVKLDKESLRRLYTWVDLNVPYYGTWKNTYANNPKQTKTVEDISSQAYRLRKKYALIDNDWEQTSTKPYSVKKCTKKGVERSQPAAVSAANWPFDEQTAIELQKAAGTVKEVIALGNGKSITMVRIPAGEFIMGSDEETPQEQPRHKIVIKKPFWMSTTEITNGEYRVFNPEHDSMVYDQQWKDHTRRGYDANKDEQPVIRVSYVEAMEFCKWLSQKLGKKVNLPTEAQWEWACRAGSTYPMSFGTTSSDFSKYANLADKSIEKHAVNGVNPTHKKYLIGNPTYDFIPRVDKYDDGNFIVSKPGSYKPNAWGLYDMHGNVAEWTRSDLKPYPYTEAYNTLDNVTKKSVRGGSWRDRPYRATSSYRLGYNPWQRVYNVGFRIIIEE